MTVLGLMRDFSRRGGEVVVGGTTNTRHHNDPPDLQVQSTVGGCSGIII